MANLMLCLGGLRKIMKNSVSKPVSRAKYEPETSQTQSKRATHLRITFLYVSCFFVFKP
jgi:hypothetical protein